MISPRSATLSSAFLAILLLPLPAFGDTITVPGDAPDIAQAVALAGPGDTVLVGPGDHLISTAVSFEGKTLSLRSEMGPASTTLLRDGPPDDEERGSLIILEAGEAAGTLIEGFTLRYGRGSRWGLSSEQAGGGALLLRGGSQAEVRHCVFLDNSGSHGGAIFCTEGSSITVLDCLFERNRCTNFGGAILLKAVGDSSRVERCEFRRNLAASGGALFCLSGSSPTIVDSLLVSNQAYSVGGGLCCLIDSSPRIERCRFLGNLAFGAGAVSFETATDSPRIENSVFAGNLAQVAGGVQSRGGASPLFLHATITLNAAFDEAGGVSCPGGAPRIYNSIVTGNSPESACGDLQGSLLEGDPRFEDPGVFDFERYVEVAFDGPVVLMPDFVVKEGTWSIREDSPAIDLGLVAHGLPTDLYGADRPCGEGPDAGAVERCGPGPGTRLVRADSNGDTRIDLSDAVFILNYLFVGGASPTCFDGLDVNDDGKLQITDPIHLLTFLFSGGPPPGAPFPDCGSDPTPDDGVSCERYAGC